MMRLTALFGAIAWLGLSSEAASTDGRYSLNAETVMHAESSVGTYDRTINATLEATLKHSGSDVSLELRRDDHVCTLNGALSGNSLFLEQGQKCPQSIKGDGFQADLDGTLQSGSASIVANELRLVMKWGVRGTVKIGPLPIGVTGTLSTTANGTRS